MRITFGSVLPFKSRSRQPVSRDQTVAVYGGNSVKENTPLYDFCRQVGAALAEAGFGVLTGGSSYGAMKAVTDGAKDKGGYTYGMAMPFIGETPYARNDELYEFETFSERIDDGYESRAALTAAVPGGIGTYQEITKKATELLLDKTLHPSQKQIVLFEFNGFWQKFVDHLREGPMAAGLMSPRVLEMLKIARSIPEGIAMLKQSKKDVPWTPGIRPVPEKVRGRRVEQVA